MCEAERCSADMRDRSCVSAAAAAAAAAAASDADGSAVVSLDLRQGWARTEEEEGGGGGGGGGGRMRVIRAALK